MSPGWVVWLRVRRWSGRMVHDGPVHQAPHEAPDQAGRPARCSRASPPGPADQGPHQTAPPRRHRHHRSRGPGPRDRRHADRAPGCGRGQRRAQHQRPLSQPRPGAADPGRRAAASTASGPRSSAGSPREGRCGSTGRRCTWTDAPSPRASCRRRSRSGRHDRGQGRARRADHAFAANTLEYVQRDRDMLLDGIDVPELRTSLEGKHVLVVVRGYHHREDLAALRSYIREFKPLMIGVDGGADALLESRVPAPRHRRGHGLDIGRRAAVRRRAGGARLPRRAGARPGAGRVAEPAVRAVPGRRAPARTSRCSSPTSRAPT